MIKRPGIKAAIYGFYLDMPGEFLYEFLLKKEILITFNSCLLPDSTPMLHKQHEKVYLIDWPDKFVWGIS